MCRVSRYLSISRNLLVSHWHVAAACVVSEKRHPNLRGVNCASTIPDVYRANCRAVKSVRPDDDNKFRLPGNSVSGRGNDLSRERHDARGTAPNRSRARAWHGPDGVVTKPGPPTCCVVSVTRTQRGWGRERELPSPASHRSLERSSFSSASREGSERRTAARRRRSSRALSENRHGKVPVTRLPGGTSPSLSSSSLFLVSFSPSVYRACIGEARRRLGIHTANRRKTEKEKRWGEGGDYVSARGIARDTPRATVTE